MADRNTSVSFAAETTSLNKLFSQKGLQPHYAKDSEPLPEHTVVRERFCKRWEFLLTFVGYVVGPSNVFRFPYLVLKNNGAVFVILYLVAVVVVGFPLSFLELVLGQFSGKNSVRVWDLCPAFRGVGFSSLIVCWLTALTFQVTMSHCLTFAFSTLGHKFPWAECESGWKNCFAKFEDLKNWTARNNKTYCSQNTTSAGTPCVCKGDFNTNCEPTPRSAADFYYFEDIVQVQKHAESVEDFGYPPWRVVLLLLFSWMLVTVCMLHGIRYTTKFLWVTVILPYLGLIILVGQGATMSGAIDGLHLLFVGDGLDWEHMKNSQMWVEAISQALFSMNTILGELTIISSYRMFRNRDLACDLAIVTALDVFSSLLSAVVIFQIMGYTSYQAGEEFKTAEMPRKDIGLVFLTFPTILMAFQLPHLWTFLFFFMLYAMVIDTEFGLVETVLTYLQDDFRVIRRHAVKSRILFSLVSFFVGIILACPGGYQVVKVIDEAVISLCLPILGLLEVCVVMWGYGVGKFLSDLEYMLAVELKGYYLLALYFSLVLPLSMMGLFIGSFIYGFSDQRSGRQLLLILTVLLPVPLWLVAYGAQRYSVHRHLPWAKIGAKIRKPSPYWGPNDGSNIHRAVDTVFAELCGKMKSRKRLSYPGGFQTMGAGTDNTLQVDQMFDTLFLSSREDLNSLSETPPTGRRRCQSEVGPTADSQDQVEETKRRNTLN